MLYEVITVLLQAVEVVVADLGALLQSTRTTVGDLSIIRLMEFVITSYSIHYTKLYDEETPHGHSVTRRIRWIILV